MGNLTLIMLAYSILNSGHSSSNGHRDNKGPLSYYNLWDNMNQHWIVLNFREYIHAGYVYCQVAPIHILPFILVTQTNAFPRILSP